MCTTRWGKGNSVPSDSGVTTRPPVQQRCRCRAAFLHSQLKLLRLRRRCELNAPPVADPVRPGQLAHTRSRRLGLALRQVRVALVQPLVLGQELGPVAFAPPEEVLLRAGLAAEEGG